MENYGALRRFQTKESEMSRGMDTPSGNMPEYEAWPEAYAEEKWAPGTHLFKPGGTLANPRACELCGRNLNNPVHQVRPDLLDQKRPEPEAPEDGWPWHRDSAETMKAVQDLLVATFTELNGHGAPPTQVSVGWERPDGPRFQMTVMPAEVDE